MVFLGSFLRNHMPLVKKVNPMPAINTRHQTKEIEDKLIKAPNIAVNPKSMTAI